VAYVVCATESVGQKLGYLLAEIVIGIVTTERNPDITGEGNSAYPWLTRSRKNDDHRPKTMTILVD